MPPPRASLSSVAGSSAISPGEPSPQENEARKRVTKACDRCRLKKIKCDGQMPCSRCSIENSICRYGERKATTERRIPPGYVEYLEEQQQLLVRALKKSYALAETTSGVLGDDPPVHAILENLNIFADVPARQQRDSTFQFEEDLDVLRERCEAEVVAGSSASTTTSQVVSAEPTPSRLSPEREASPEAAFQPSRARTWSPSHPFQHMPPDALTGQRQPSPSVSSRSGLFLPQTASAPPSMYETTGPEYFHAAAWQQPPLAHVHSEPTPSPAFNYWSTPQNQPHQQQQGWHPSQTQAEQHYGTVDPSTLMLPPTNEAYLQTAEAWAEYLREQQRRQR